MKITISITLRLVELRLVTIQVCWVHVYIIRSIDSLSIDINFVIKEIKTSTVDVSLTSIYLFTSIIRTFSCYCFFSIEE